MSVIDEAFWVEVRADLSDESVSEVPGARERYKASWGSKEARAERGSKMTESEIYRRTSRTRSQAVPNVRYVFFH